MTNWSEAGRKAWATRQRNDALHVLSLYRRAFGGTPKGAARSRAIEVLKRSGGTVVLDLWGGGLSALELMAAGFRVIAVEDGSLPLIDEEGRVVSAARKKRALIAAALGGGYEWRWGKASKFASDADCALLDFCGPWSREVKRTIQASRHMKTVVLTLMTDHEIATGATDQTERLAAYQSFMRLAFGVSLNPFNRHGTVKLLGAYRRPRGQPVWIFALAHHRLFTGPVPRALWTPDRVENMRIKSREEKRRLTMDPDWVQRTNERRRQRHADRMRDDPEYRARMKRYNASRDPEVLRAYQREYRARNRDRLNEYHRQWEADRRGETE